MSLLSPILRDLGALRDRANACGAKDYRVSQSFCTYGVSES